MQRDDLREFEHRVVAVVDPAIDALMSGPLRRPSARVDARANGRDFHSGLFEYPSGSSENPLSEQAIHTKFRTAAAPVIGQGRADEVLARLNRIEDERNVRSLLEICRSA